MLPLLTHMLFFMEIHVFLQLSSIGLFEAKRAYQLLETPKLHEVFLSQFNSVLIVKTMCYMVQHLTEMISFVEIHVFLQLSIIGLSGANTAYLHNEN